MNNQKNGNGAARNVAERVKDGADVAFDAAKNSIQATEDIAMTAVDKTADVIDQTTNSVSNAMGNQQNRR
ncbi:hypothetical protein CVD28_25295 [Bacillus sp. M6-12]|uniref:hypothetical protein n=1 Tax=Bacillus sp. M6-12 TaxID=2054166 RepID=UPI000C7702E9|nr:hypothetical protein [Bacillus sp. M6-12]PLS14843.1 hypothetical protein CVD28_25295 [Bacillus sp. M6-12]